MTEKPQTTEEVAFTLRRMVIDHLKGVYVRQPPTCGMIADSDLQYTLELICDHLPSELQTHIKEILDLHSLLWNTPIDRYYVQHLSTTHFVVRERQADQLQPLPSDKLVRDEFSTHPDAACYTQAMNELQRKLDLEYGRWTKHAVVNTQTEETKDE